jgi:hypothetical protein
MRLIDPLLGALSTESMGQTGDCGYELLVQPSSAMQLPTGHAGSASQSTILRSVLNSEGCNLKETTSSMIPGSHLNKGTRKLPAQVQGVTPSEVGT